MFRKTTDSQQNRSDMHIDRRDVVLAGLYGVLLAAALMAGKMLEREGALRTPSAGEFLTALLRFLTASCVTLTAWHSRDLHSRRRMQEENLARQDADSEPSCQDGPDKKQQRRRSMRKRSMLLWLFFMCVQMVSLLAVYPGFFVYDASEELAMVETRTFTTHHPLLHVLLLGGCILAVHKVTGSYNLGIFCYLLFQMAVMDGVLVMIVQEVSGGRIPSLAWLLQSVRRTNSGKREGRKSRNSRNSCECRGILTILWLALCPVITMYVLCSCKDGLFAAALIAMTIFLRRLLRRHIGVMETGNPVRIAAAAECENVMRGNEEIPAASRQDWKNLCGFVLAATLMMLLRNNGVYAYAVFLLLLAIGAAWGTLQAHRRKDNENNNRKNGREVIGSRSGKRAEREILFLMPLVLYLLFSKGLIFATGATQAESQEILTVPIMQLARVWNADLESFTDEDRIFMLQLMGCGQQEETTEETSETAGTTESSEQNTAKGTETLADTDIQETGWDYYNPVLSDQVKIRFRSDVYRKNRKAFWSLWLRKGCENPISYLNAWLMTSYGFWTPGAIVDCYQGNTVYTFTYGDSSYFGYETELPGIRKSMIPALDGWYRYLSLDAWAQEMPVLGWILSPGVLAWCWGWCLVTILRRGGIRKVLPYLPILMVWLTVLLGPCTLPRYVVYLWIGIPVVAGDVICDTEGRTALPRRRNTDTDIDKM